MTKPHLDFNDNTLISLWGIQCECTCLNRHPHQTPAASPCTNYLIRLLITPLIAYRQHEGQPGNKGGGLLRTQPDKPHKQRSVFLTTVTTTTSLRRVETEAPSALLSYNIAFCDGHLLTIKSVEWRSRSQSDNFVRSSANEHRHLD